jgi:hypothetical protein
MVEKFRSPSSGHAELAAVLPSLQRGTRIDVPGVPGARGFLSTGRKRSAYTIVFAAGPHFYLVRIGWQARYRPAPTRGVLVAAVERLNDRVNED